MKKHMTEEEILTLTTKTWLVAIRTHSGLVLSVYYLLMVFYVAFIHPFVVFLGVDISLIIILTAKVFNISKNNNQSFYHLIHRRRIFEFHLVHLKRPI